MNNSLVVCFILGLFFISNVNALVIDSVIMDSEGIFPGEATDIEIGLRNNGEEDVEDVSVFLDLKDLPLAPHDSSSEFGVDKIKEGRLKFARFKIIALDNAKSQIYKVPVQISYFKKGEDVVQIKNSLISVKVSSDPVLDVVTESLFLLKGQENNLIIKMINKGFSGVHFLEAEVGKSSKFNVISQKNVYVGDLDSDDFDSVEFSIFFEKDISDKISFPIILKYKDAFNNEYEEEFGVILNVYSKGKAEDLGLIEKSRTPQIIILVIIFIILWFVYRWWRKWRRNKKKGSEEF